MAVAISEVYPGSPGGLSLPDNTLSDDAGPPEAEPGFLSGDSEERETDGNGAALTERKRLQFYSGKVNGSGYRNRDGFNPLDIYLQDIGQYSLLSHVQTVELFIRKERCELRLQEIGRELAVNDLNGNRPVLQDERQELTAELNRVRDTVVNHNLRLVVAVVRHYRNRGLDMSDLIQHGNFGLMKAVDRYDYRKGWTFGTYAPWWISHTVARAIKNEGRGIRLPVRIAEAVSKVRRARYELANALGHEPSDGEIGSHIGMSAAAVRQFREIPTVYASLNQPVGDNEDTELGDTLPDTDSPTPEEAILEQTAGSDILETAKQVLSKRNFEILLLRYGAVDGQVHSLADIARRYGLTRERARQIMAESLDVIRQLSRDGEVGGRTALFFGKKPKKEPAAIRPAQESSNAAASGPVNSRLPPGTASTDRPARGNSLYKSLAYGYDRSETAETNCRRVTAEQGDRIQAMLVADLKGGPNHSRLGNALIKALSPAERTVVFLHLTSLKAGAGVSESFGEIAGMFGERINEPPETIYRRSLAKLWLALNS